jgi:peptide/nickel transport system substrate-binding protein
MMVRTGAVALMFLTVIPACFSSAASPDSRLVQGRSDAVCRPESTKAETLFKGTPTFGGSAAIRILREPTSLLSLVDSDPIVSGMINHTVLETLIRISLDGEDVIPELAERFEVDEEKHRYIFYLTPNARWNDGLPVTAQDVQFVFSKLADPFSPSPLFGVFSNIADIDAPDEETVVFTLDRRVPEFLDAVAAVPILPLHIFGRTPWSVHDASRVPVGSGPYRFVRWVPSQLIELERNPEWRGEPPFLDQIRYVIVPDNRIAVDMFSHGDLDMILDFPVGAKSDEQEGSVQSFALPIMEALIFNSRSAVFQDVSIRKAVSMLIDRKTVQSSALDCRADLPEDSPLSLRGDSPLFRSLPFHRQRAERLLDDAGWHRKNGDGIRMKNGALLSFSLLIPNLGLDVERASVLIQEDLAEVGIEMKIVIVSRGAFMGRLDAERFDAAAVPLPLRGEASTPSWFDGRRGIVSRISGISDSVMDSFVERLRMEISDDGRRALIAHIARRIETLTPASFLYRPHTSQLIRSDLRGIRLKDGWTDVTTMFRVARTQP